MTENDANMTTISNHHETESDPPTNFDLQYHHDRPQTQYVHIYAGQKAEERA
jgi:hypothetical protein